MVAYSFKAQFAAPILAGVKRQTLRNDRKRHARPGETLQLFTGMRTRQCRLVGTATCKQAAPIRLHLDCGRVEFLWTGRALTTIEELDGFAQIDGFARWRAMCAFWSKEHPSVPTWEGVQISWGETFQAAP